jgi:tetratricopeptide (TPR) repeat protein
MIYSTPRRACERCSSACASVMAELDKPTLEATVVGPPGGSRAVDVAHEIAAPRIGRFSVLRKIGEGGMGVVFAGYDEQLDRKVAIKLLHRSSGPSGLRLAREAQGLARLSHPNVVQVYEIGEHDGAPFIAMEFVDGDTLSAWCEKRPRSWSEQLPILLAAGQGLAAAHGKGLIHRDFKPDNVMVDADGRVRVMDFGLVRGTGDDDAEVSEPASQEVPPPISRSSALAETGVPSGLAETGVPSSSSGSASSGAVMRDRLTRTGSVMGTPAYMSPEQFMGISADARSDQFSFCVTVWELLYGQRPFAGESFTEVCLAVTGGELREPPRDAAVPGWIRKVLERGLATEPEQRWPSMAPLLAALADDPRRRRAAVLFGAVSLALVFVVLGLRGCLNEAERERGEQTCVEEGQAIATVWNDEISHEIAAAFTASKLPFADDSWNRTRTQLDAYADEWAATRTGACRETLLEHTREDASLTQVRGCLDDAQVSLTATVEVLRNADARLVAHAARLPVSLPRLSACVDEASLALRPITPERVELDELRADLERASALGIVGDYEASLVLAARVANDATSLGWPPFEAQARLLVGDLQRDLGDTATAQESYGRAFALAGETGADDTAMRAATKLALLIGHDLARYDEGLMWGQVATMMVRRLHAEDGLDEAGLQVVMGRVEFDAADYPEARNRLLRAQELFEAALGERHPEVSVALEALAAVDQAMGDSDQALARLARAVEIREAAYGPHHPEVATLLAATGSVHDDRGEFERARELMERALEIRETAFGPEHPDVAESLLGLGVVDGNLGYNDQALERFERALAIREAASVPNRKRIADLLLNTALIHSRLGHADEALRANERALAFYEATLGPSHPRLALVLVNISHQRRMQERFDEAERALERAMQIYEFNFGPEHASLASVHLGFGVLAADRGDLDAALAANRRAVELLERIHGAEHLDVAQALTSLAQIHVRRRELEPARAAYERALAIELRSATVGSMSAGTREQLANVLWDLGERDAAREQIVAAREQLDVVGDAETLAQLDAWILAHPD